MSQLFEVVGRMLKLTRLFSGRYSMLLIILGFLGTAMSDEEDSQPTDMLSSDKPKKKYPCSLCSKSFAQSQGLSRHRRNDHPDDEFGGSIGCCCCSSSFTSYDGYRIHCSQKHASDGKKFDKFTAVFSTEDDFLQWRARIQEETRAGFSVETTNKLKDDAGRIRRFRCSCDGSKPTHSDRERYRESQKMGSACPAYINAKVMLGSSEVIVEGNLDHLGHEMKLGHMRINPELRSWLASLLGQGMTPKQILKQIRTRIDGSFNRSHIVDRKDIQNIRRQFHMDKSRKDDNDHSSVVVSLC